MDRQTGESQHSRLVSGKDEAVDSEVGMAVSDHGGRRIGTIISQLRDQADRAAPVPGLVQPTQRGRWHRWLPGRRP